MKNKLKYVLSFIFALAIFITMSGCGTNEQNQQTTQNEQSQQTNQPVSNEPSGDYDIQSTEVNLSEITQESEALYESTVEYIPTEPPKGASPANTTPVGIPVNGTAEQIVSYYNKTVNGVCNKTVKVTRTTEMTGELVDSSGMAASFFEGNSEEMFGETAPETETISFVNGKSDSTTLGEFMPRGNGTPSELTTAGVTKADCIASNGNYVLTLYITDESGNATDWSPVHHNSCMSSPMDYNSGFFNGTPGEAPSVEMPSGSFEDMEGTMSMSYYDGKITAVIDPDGNILSLELYEPIRMEMDMKMAVFSASMTMEMKLTQRYTFSY